MSIVAGDRLNHAQEQRLRLIDFLLVHYGGSTSGFFETLRSLTGNEAPTEWTDVAADSLGELALQQLCRKL